MKIRSFLFAATLVLISSSALAETCFVQQQVEVEGIPARICLDVKKDVGGSDVEYVIITTDKNRVVQFVRSDRHELSALLYREIPQSETCGNFESYSVELKLASSFFGQIDLESAELSILRESSIDLCHSRIHSARYYYVRE